MIRTSLDDRLGSSFSYIRCIGIAYWARAQFVLTARDYVFLGQTLGLGDSCCRGTLPNETVVKAGEVEGEKESDGRRRATPLADALNAARKLKQRSPHVPVLVARVVKTYAK